MCLPNFLGATFIPGATSIPESRVDFYRFNLLEIKYILQELFHLIQCIDRVQEMIKTRTPNMGVPKGIEGSIIRNECGLRMLL